MVKEDLEKVVDRVLKKNAIKLAQHHRLHCEGEHCDISLLLLAELLKRANITVFDKEMEDFA